MLDEKMQEFLRRLDAAISLAQEKMRLIQSENGADWLIGSYATLIDNLETLRGTASQGKLPRQSQGQVPEGTGLGISRGVGEWCEDDQMLDTLLYVEIYYRHAL
jgi:hypothetical protein